MPTKTQLERVIVYAIGGLNEVEARLADGPGCWCPGAGDQECDLHMVRDVLRALKRRAVPGALVSYDSGSDESTGSAT